MLLGAAGRERALEAIVAVGRRLDARRVDHLDRPTGSRSCAGDGAKPDASTAGPTVWVIQDVVDDDEKLRARLERLAALDVDEIVVAFDTVERDEILPVLDRYEKVIAANAG